MVSFTEVKKDRNTAANKPSIKQKHVLNANIKHDNRPQKKFNLKDPDDFAAWFKYFPSHHGTFFRPPLSITDIFFNKHGMNAVQRRQRREQGDVCCLDYPGWICRHTQRCDMPLLSTTPHQGPVRTWHWQNQKRNEAAAHKWKLRISSKFQLFWLEVTAVAPMHAHTYTHTHLFVNI